MDGEHLPYILLSFIFGVILSQWYLVVQHPEAVLSGNHSFRVEKYSSVARIKTNHGKLLGTVDMGDSKIGTILSRYNERCVQMRWESSKDSVAYHARHELASGNWYGGPSYYHARWPINKHEIPYQQYLTDDLLARPHKFGSILDRYWLSSEGVGIYAPFDYADFYYGVHKGAIQIGSQSNLLYIICWAGSAKETHEYMISRFIGKPEGLPDKTMLTSPIWSTWAKYKIYINQSAILNFGQEIKDYNFAASQLEIDDTYTTNYGDHEFDTTRFPKPKEMLSQLKSMGYRVTAWVHPFVNYDTKAFQEGVKERFLLETNKHSVVGVVKWWQGTGAMIDMFNNRAVTWFKSKLDKLKALGIDSFKFDAGEACYMPQDIDKNPNLITRKYVEVASSYGGMVETRVAYRTQRLPIFLRMMDKHSYWGFDNGLKTMIPSALQLSILGYNYVLPDMIGGNAMGPDDDWYSGEIPEKELYIRWFQLCTFLQSMQISIAPWQYDQETTDIALKLVKIHQEFVAPRIIELAEHAVKTGEPIIRPLWWIDPEDITSYDIEDEFLIGNDVLVAPIVEKGAKNRSIYLPHATWKDLTTHEQFVGPKWIWYNDISLDTIPYFLRVTY